MDNGVGVTLRHGVAVCSDSMIRVIPVCMHGGARFMRIGRIVYIDGIQNPVVVGIVGILQIDIGTGQPDEFGCILHEARSVLKDIAQIQTAVVIHKRNADRSDDGVLGKVAVAGLVIRGRRRILRARETSGVQQSGRQARVAEIALTDIQRAQNSTAVLYCVARFDLAASLDNRAGVDIVRGSEGQDPASVVFDALRSAKAKNTDILICDTAGRLHNKKNLMEELKKIHRIIDKEYPEALRETLVVIDGTTGQNGLIQAREFHEAADATGIIMTKLDGTAKGGIAIAVQSELNIPVKFIGVGEGLDDLQRFDPDAFVEALFASDNKDPDDEAADDMTLDAEDEDVNT